MRIATLRVGADAGARGCEPDSVQLAEAYLFNQPAAKVRACFGEPDRRIPVGIEQIWVYRIGRLQVDGWLAALGPDERPTFSAPTATARRASPSTATACAASPTPTTRGRADSAGRTCEIAVRRA